jgi:hypothetical protein
MVYCIPYDVKLLSGLTADDVDDTYISALIKKATARVNSDISTDVTLEFVDNIDSYRENKIDGSNKTFYTRNSWKYSMGDLNDDGALSVADIEVWQYDTVNGTRAQVIPASLTVAGCFTLTNAPSVNDELYITYRFQPICISPVHPLIEQATAYMASALAYTRIQPADYKNVQIGRLKYSGDSGPVQKFLDVYDTIVGRIDDFGLIVARPGNSYRTIDFEGMGSEEEV